MTPEEILSQRRVVITEALSWAKPKTPYHHGAQIKGAGVSCSQFVAAVFNAAIGTHLTVLDHVEQWYLNGKDQLYTDSLKVQGFLEIPKDQVQVGDLVVSNTVYELYCHSGIIANWPSPPTVIHVSRNGCERVPSMLSSWYFTQKPDTHLYFSWGEWH